MEWDVTEVSIKSDNALFVRFKDGVQGTVEFANSFFYGVFEKLKDLGVCVNVNKYFFN
jgi:hypothetical protein